MFIIGEASPLPPSLALEKCNVCKGARRRRRWPSNKLSISTFPAELLSTSLKPPLLLDEGDNCRGPGWQQPCRRHPEDILFALVIVALKLVVAVEEKEDEKEVNAVLVLALAVRTKAVKNIHRFAIVRTLIVAWVNLFIFFFRVVRRKNNERTND